MKTPLTGRTFTCSFQTMVVLFEGFRSAIMADVEKAAMSLRRLSGREDHKEAELAILKHLKENTHPGWFRFEDLAFKTCLEISKQGRLQLQLQTADQERDHIGSKKVLFYIVQDLQTDTYYYAAINYVALGRVATVNILSFSESKDSIESVTWDQVEFASKDKPRSITEAIAIGVVVLHKTLNNDINCYRCGCPSQNT
jgi:hypothetical protein